MINLKDERFTVRKAVFIGYTTFDEVLEEIYGEGAELTRDGEDDFYVEHPDGHRIFSMDALSEIKKVLGIDLAECHTDTNGVWFTVTEPVAYLDAEPVSVAQREYGPDTFEYLGYHFTPVEILKGKDANFFAISNHLKTDRKLGFSKYDWKKKNYSHEGFYAAYGKADYHLFRCEENGKIYIPAGNELFEYMY